MTSPTQGHSSTTPKEQKSVTVVRITDPTLIGETIEILGQDVVSLETENFEIKRVTVPFEDCCLVYQKTSARLRTRTQIHDDYDACSSLGPNSHGSLDGAELTPFSVIVAAPGASAEIIAEQGYETVALLVPPKVMAEHLTLRGRSSDIQLWDGITIQHPSADVARRNFELGVRIATQAEETPGIFNDHRWARYGAQVEAMDSLLATIESSNTRTDINADSKGKTYSEIVRTCEDFTLSLEGRRPYLSELCEVAHVSERTLQYAFKDIMGMSPFTYLHRLRLHRARDELRHASKKFTSVTEVALNWGFWHFGEFSQAYKNCFDESPSTTLKRAGVPDYDPPKDRLDAK